MNLPTSNAAQPSHRQRPRWPLIAFYVSLLLVVGALEYYFSSDSDVAAELPARSESRRDDSPSSVSVPERTTQRGDERLQPDHDVQADSTADVKARRDNRSSNTRVAENELPTDAHVVRQPPPAGAGNAPKPPRTERSTQNASKPQNARDGPSADKLTVRNMTIRDENRRVVYRGDVDLRPTLDRIEQGRRLRFPNDGSVFQNRERRLPQQPAGYYREYVHPTPNDDRPGAQRLVVGREGEVYYTPDHYRTFRRIR